MRRRYRGSIEKYKEFLRANSNARDCDIIAGRLAALGAPGMSDLQEKKRAELAKAVVIARSLEKLRPMRPVRLDNKRIDKMASRLVGRIEELLPVTLSDGSRVEEIHKMRRNFRKLRYIMEVLPPACQKKCMKNCRKVIGKAVSLQEMQDLLGSIHDCDITIEYLRSKGATQVLGKEIANRTQLYNRFVRYMKK